jgi:uncharacterized protein YraI
VSIQTSQVIFLLLTLLITGCGVEVRRTSPSTATPVLLTLTLPATLGPAPPETSSPIPPQPTTPSVVPAEGTTLDQVNVRAEPSTASNILGIIPANTKVEIVGKDPGESWWQINYPQGATGKGWVTAQFITTATKPEVPTIGGSVDPNSENVAIIQQQLNVRSGPGTSFNSLGTLNPQDVVRLTGKDANGAWLQIDFPSGPDGKGWVNAAFVQARGVENLPIITEAGQIIGTGTPTLIPSTPTPTVIPAWEDGDSAESPIASVIFEPNGTQTLIYSGNLSFPQGDSEDWIAFKPYGRFVYVSLACQENEALNVEMIDNNLPTRFDVVCGNEMKEVAVTPGSNYVVHIEAIPSAGELQYTNYTLIIKTRP